MKDTPKKIILVDDNITSLALGRNALAGKYHVLTVPSGEKLFVILQKVKPDLILLDIEMPEMNGYEALKILKANPETKHIPVMFLTGNISPGEEAEGLSAGAVAYILKPFSPQHLLDRLEEYFAVMD